LATVRDPRRIVAEGYDRIAERYAAWIANDLVDEVRPRYTAVLLEGLPPGAAVLDLGCGSGVPTTRQLAERFAVTGVDISARQVALARENVPRAQFLQADMTRLSFPPNSFDGVAAFYAFTHLPHGELPGLVVRITSWLRPGGLLVASMGASADLGSVEPDWLGAPMYFSGYSVEEGQHFIEMAGLAVVRLQVETILEDQRPVAFTWVVAQKPMPIAASRG
jgi:SAM-dependent methyltransferase